VNWQGSHLSDRQIEEYVSESSAERPSLPNKDAHIAACDLCRKRVLEAERAHLGMLQRHPSENRYPGCPDDDILQQYAAGLCAPDVAAEVLHHAAHCDFCAPLLKGYMEDLSDDLTADAKDFVTRLPASETGWRGLVGKHASPRPSFLAKLWKRFFSFQTPALAWRAAAFAGGLALVAFSVVLPGLINRVQISKAEKLTVAAFAENPDTRLRYALSPRTWDTKLKEEGPAVAPSSLHALHAAETLADEHQDSSNAKWLRINGQLALLTKDVNAVAFLKAAYDKGLQDPGTEIDLAAAYFLRDTNNGKTKDQTPAHDVNATIDLLLKVLKEPQLPADTRATALFDLAVAYETMQWFDQAIPRWEEYLKLDSSGPWAEEAERHLREDRSKKQPPRPQGHKDFSFFENHSSDREVQDSIEEYQDAALKTWFLELASSRAPEAAQAIHTLADVLEQQHGDPWLKDFLSRRQPGDWRGIQALSSAITNNRRGAHAVAKLEAEAAEQIFARTANSPGVLRSQFEAMYANQRSLDSAGCVEQAPRLESALRGTAYRWLQIQLALTQASCLNRNEDFAAADEKLAIGYQNAVTFRFHILQLRALMLDAGMKVTRGDCDASFRSAAAGLNLYWRGPSSPFWLYQLYSTMKQCLEKQNLMRPFEAKWHAEEALERRMIAILETEISPEDKDSNFENTAHNALQLILTALNEPLPETAANLRPDPQSATSRLPIDIQLAALQLEVGGNAEAALATLGNAEKLVTTTKDDLIRLDFYTVRGNVLLKMQQLDAAEAAYATGVEMAERARGSLENDKERLKWRKKTDEIYRGLVGVFLGQGRNEQALQLWEWYLSRPWVSDPRRETPANQVSWPEIESEFRGVLIPVTAVDTRVIYAFVRDNVYIWTIGSAGMTPPQAVPITQEQLEHRIRDYAEELRDENSNVAGLERDSERLFTLLLLPAMPQLMGDGAVVIELDPLMNDLPLEALQSPEGWYFGQRYPVVYSPGLVKERDLRPVAKRPPASSWLLNALNTDDQSLADRLRGIKVLNASEMTPAKLATRLAESEMFIFWGHGDSGTLRMPNRSPLRADDFPPDSLQKLQLAALIACSSGSGRDGILDTANLVHAMLSGGVPAVIASQWDVSRDSTNRLLGSFYENYTRGETAARSMLEARQQVFRSGNTHPYHWAAFTITGKAR
jgi:CHAT domain-containing protein